jgi:hypothetical protein
MNNMKAAFNCFKENVDTNVKENEHLNSDGLLGGKLFKFKKSNGVVKKFGEENGNPFTQLINLEPE